MKRSGRQGDGPRGFEQLAVAALPSALVVLALLVAASSPRLAPTGIFDRPFELLGWLLIGAVAALHRPLGDRPAPVAEPDPGAPALSLGLGAAVLPALYYRQGAVVAAVGAFLILLLSELLLTYVLRRLERPDDGSASLVPALERSMLFAFIVLVTTTVDGKVRSFAEGEWAVWAPLVSGLVYLTAFGLSVSGLARFRRLSFDALRVLPPLVLDFAGWIFGSLVVVLASEVGWQRVWWLWPAMVLLVAEAARNALLRGRADQRLGSFERLQEAHERILSETSGMGGIAQQVLIECRNVLPVQWFQFELPEDDDYWQSWAAGPDGLLVEGRPKPPARPNMLPGIHRSAPWKILERSLIRTEEGHEQVMARLRLWCDPRRVEAGASDLLDTLVPQMASSVHRARLDREAKLDPLTGVPVRRVLESRLQRAYRHACEEGKPMAVIMCDIDFFKKVNDTHGHVAGDEALKLVAATLDAERRERDLCCRYGGEEFTLLLEDTDGDAALRLAERLRRAVQALRLVFEGSPIPLTLSLGVAGFPELHIKTASELLLLADEALYEAKGRGRNQCLLNIGREAYRAPEAVGRQESSTIIPRPQL